MPAPTPVGSQPAPAPAIPETVPAPAVTPAPTPSVDGKIRFNFQGAQFSDVLSYMSEACGFVIVQDSPVTGTVNVMSRQPLTPDDAVDLLNTLLAEKNFTAIRDGRILKIVSRTDAPKRDLPVVTGADPDQIPRKDNMVTQILPVRYADVSKLIDNLRPLLSDEASISANDASNAIILTDSQTNVHRIAEIIRALDTSISGISTIHVFPLQFADAKSISDVITQLFQSTTSTSNTQNGGGGGPGGGFPGFMGFGRRGGGGGDDNATTQSAARSAASRVVAVSDEQSNSVIVSAPDEYMASIADIVSRLDTSIAAVSETRIFRLDHADCGEMASILSTLYGDTSTQNNKGGNNNNNGFPFFRFGGAQAAATPAQSQRSLQEAHVVAVPDPRTNSVIVTCSHDTMTEIANTIGRLDATDAKKQHIRVYTLENADPDNVASILRGMFTVNGANTTQTQNTTDVLSQRTTSGASSDVVNTLNTSGNSSSGGGGGGGGGSGGFR
jgi:general secretion pathway protein D